MMISTRGRYALRVMVDLAQNAGPGFVPMKEVAARQEISLKYLERIMPVLAKNDFVIAAPGRGGGYRLACPAEDCRVGDILRLTEGTLAPVACLASGAPDCHRSAGCFTLPMWTRFNEMANNFFDSISIRDLAEQSLPGQIANV